MGWVAALLLLGACAGAKSAEAPSGDPQAAGERLYRSHCAACHRLRDPKEQTRARWAWAVENFGPRAHLTPEERQLVLSYLQANTRDAGEGTGAGGGTAR